MCRRAFKDQRQALFRECGLADISACCDQKTEAAEQECGAFYYLFRTHCAAAGHQRITLGIECGFCQIGSQLLNHRMRAGEQNLSRSGRGRKNQGGIVVRKFQACVAGTAGFVKVHGQNFFFTPAALHNTVKERIGVSDKILHVQRTSAGFVGSVERSSDFIRLDAPLDE